MHIRTRFAPCPKIRIRFSLRRILNKDSPGQNWVYADDQGNIGYTTAVGIPVRKGFDGSIPMPGWDGRHEWSGYVPTSQQPRMLNPNEVPYEPGTPALG